LEQLLVAIRKRMRLDLQERLIPHAGELELHAKRLLETFFAPTFHESSRFQQALPSMHQAL